MKTKSYFLWTVSMLMFILSMSNCSSDKDDYSDNNKQSINVSWEVVSVTDTEGNPIVEVGKNYSCVYNNYENGECVVYGIRNGSSFNNVGTFLYTPGSNLYAIFFDNKSETMIVKELTAKKLVIQTEADYIFTLTKID